MNCNLFQKIKHLKQFFFFIVEKLKNYLDRNFNINRIISLTFTFVFVKIKKIFLVKN